MNFNVNLVLQKHKQFMDSFLKKDFMIHICVTRRLVLARPPLISDEKTLENRTPL
jgi:hypothetical protein